MTFPPNRTPPPAARKPLSSPPAPPRKPRRGVRKRRRPPRETRAPACIVCHRKRPLRASGLCWSLECALRAADDASPSGGGGGRGEDAGKQQQFLCGEGGECEASGGVGDALPELGSGSGQDAATVQQPQLGGSETRERVAEDGLDRRNLEEEIRRQEKDVHRGEGEGEGDAAGELGMLRVRSENSENSDGSDGSGENENKGIHVGT